MKPSFRLLLVLLVPALFASSCQNIFSSSQKGRLIVSFSENSTSTRAVDKLFDTDNYILKITDSKSKIIYEGLYKASPEYFDLPAGTYTISALSEEFSSPLFDAPQFGDNQVVVISSGKTLSVKLLCTQQNCGINIKVDDSFINDFPDGVLIMKGQGGELMFEYNEKRTAYFQPGSIQLSLADLADEQLLFTRILAPRQILNLTLSCASDYGTQGVSIQIDTSRNYLEENYIYGQEIGTDIDNALSVAQAQMNVGRNDVWVYGYIVGCASGTNSFCFEPPFSKETNILIASRSNTDDKEYCLSVELKSGNIREDLNLMSNPELRGRKVYLKGDLVSSYFGIPGLKSADEYAF